MNLLDRYFEEAIGRVPKLSNINDLNIPIPNYPEHESFDPSILDSNNDYIITVKERWSADYVARRLGVREIQVILNNEERNMLDGAIREVGIDVLAFYKSRRYINNRPYPGKWGIFYLEHGIYRLKELIEMVYPGYGSSLHLAYEFLRKHEHFHYKFDIYTLSVEAHMAKALYDRLKYAFRNHSIYLVEEALANRQVWDWAKRNQVGIGEFAYDFLKLQPGAYARFDEEKIKLAGELAANLLDLNFSPDAFREDQAIWVANVPNELLRRSLCPEYFVRPSLLSTWIKPIWKLPEVRHIKENQSFSNLLNSKYVSLRDRWEATKIKLTKNPALPGLDFKIWDKKAGHWSVRINKNFRAHLRPIQNSNGEWEAIEFGPHKAMKHG